MACARQARSPVTAPATPGGVPARRSPTGYVAQRLFPDGGVLGADGIRRPWLLAFFQPGVGLAVEALTDDDVADWGLLFDRPEGNP